MLLHIMLLGQRSRPRMYIRSIGRTKMNMDRWVPAGTMAHQIGLEVYGYHQWVLMLQIGT